MITIEPSWVSELRQTLKNRVLEVGIGYGVHEDMILDSEAINRSINVIAERLETIYDNSNKKPGHLLGINGIRFGELRKKSKK